uniref:Uncharacterized protein n=1 Tax=Arundo donax TaxID=35708 RepID=A0A0A9CT30_ARUDO
MRLWASSKIWLTASMDSSRTFQSGLPKFFSKVGVILALMSSRGNPSDEPADVEDAVSKTLTVLFGAAAAPSNGFFSYSASSALRSAGFMSLKNPLISGPTNLCSIPISFIVAFLVAAALD